MISRRTTLLVSAALALFAAAPAQVVRSPAFAGEPDYFGYLQIPGVVGDVTTPRQYAGWFRVESYSLGSETIWDRRGAGAPGNSAATLVVSGDFALATPVLMLSAFQSTSYQAVTLDVFRDVANPIQVAQILLRGARLVDMGSSGETLTGGRLEFLYDSVDWTWILPGGNRTTTWDVVRTSAAPYRLEKRPSSAFPRGSYVALLHVPGVQGGATRSGYRDWIDVSDVVSGIHRASLSDPRPVPPTVEVKAYFGPGLPELAQLASVATLHPTVEVHLFRSASDPRPVLELLLTGAYVSSLIQHAQRGGAGIDLVFEMDRIEWTYVDPVSGRRTRGCWNLRTNAAC